MILKSHTSDTFSLYFLSFVFCVQFQEDKVVVTICKKIVCKKFHFVVLVPCQVPSQTCVCVCVCYKHEDFLYTKDTKSFSVVVLVVRCPPGTQKEVAKPSGLALLWHRGSLQFSSVCQGTSTTMGLSWASHTIC